MWRPSRSRRLAKWIGTVLCLMMVIVFVGSIWYTLNIIWCQPLEGTALGLGRGSCGWHFRQATSGAMPIPPFSRWELERDHGSFFDKCVIIPSFKRDSLPNTTGYT